jgi:hypothetical protein
LLLALVSTTFMGSLSAFAADACDGPSVCCGPLTEQHLSTPRTVDVGISVQGIHNLDEKTGGWDVDYYLYEKWQPLPGFTPQTEVVNETSRQDSPHFELVELRDGYCLRSRRLRSTLRVDYDLRRFPFDSQSLLIVLSDAEFNVRFAVFWIDPDDLSTQVTIGVTCLLAAIAFQFAESSSLPEVDYLTLADRVYVACYLTIALTLLESIYTNSLVRRGDRSAALRVESRARILMPAALALAVVISFVLSFRR